MRTAETVKPTCETCGVALKADEAEKHFHSLNLIHEDPLSYVVLLPAGVKFGSADAAEAFAKALGELKTKHPEKNFQLLTFGFYSGSVPDGKGGNYQVNYLESILAVAT